MEARCCCGYCVGLPNGQSADRRLPNGQLEDQGLLNGQSEDQGLLNGQWEARRVGGSRLQIGTFIAMLFP